MTEKLQLFTKPDCRFCVAAKETLSRAGLGFGEHDVSASPRTANLSVYLSGVSTVPQAFAGEMHINGSQDLVALNAAGRLAPLVAAATAAIDTDHLSDETIAHGAEDIVLKDYIPERDGTRSDDPEQWAILRFYKDFFGFWPNCFYFQHHWPESYKLFVYAHNVGAIGTGQRILGEPVMMATGFSTSEASGCNYCQVHMTSAAGEKSLGIPKLIEAARRGQAPEGSPIGPFEAALADLAAAAATNTVSDELLARVRANASRKRISQEDVEANITGTAMIASAFGFLNTFNDLAGVDIEAHWARQSEQSAGIEAGRHGVSEDRTATNLDHDLPQGGPSVEAMVAKYEAIVEAAGGVNAYTRRELGLLPDWMRLWPEHLRARHAIFYAEMMQDRDHSPVPSELKHLMARVSAIARGHDYLAAVEGLLAYRAAGSDQRAVERARHCFDAAKSRPEGQALFTEKERAALTVAWLSGQAPITTPRRFIQPAIDHWTPVELIHLFTVCGVAGLVQRFSAIARPKIEAQVRDFLEQHKLTADTLALRYPLPEERHGAAT
ncbi:glutaredoxin domain-containing protein [Martelella sp. AD-3]|uniref:glutaredoxin domain-containing protein n=1 Tax=Martelella sp. AD-3 TaxID=686597 RepID=UPI00046450FD|nr:glutaredoxin domain-containing protein [Martelella sp. AD-3]